MREEDVARLVDALREIVASRSDAIGMRAIARGALAEWDHRPREQSKEGER